MWIQPKTWKRDDNINVQDYNRIKNNIEYLHELAETMYSEIPISDMGADKTYHDHSYYADEVNLIEYNLGQLRDCLPYWNGETKIWYENNPFIDYRELNRIESASEVLYENLIGQARGRPRLPGVLGRGRCAVCR